MASTLNKRAFDHAKQLIEQGRFVPDDRDLWSEHQPSAEQENQFIEEHDVAEYAKWYLGINPNEDEHTKAHYTFPYGDFSRVHRCGVLSAEVRAGQYHYHDIERAAARLHGMLDAAQAKVVRST